MKIKTNLIEITFIDTKAKFATYRVVVDNQSEEWVYARLPENNSITEFILENYPQEFKEKLVDAIRRSYLLDAVFEDGKLTKVY